jgi:hypothetical protein
MEISAHIAFTDLASNQECTLIIPLQGKVFPGPDDAKIGIAHPGCPMLADLAIELDAFWCPRCKWNGRVSGAWCADLIRSSGQAGAPQMRPATADKYQAPNPAELGRRLRAADQPGKHLWTMVAAWSVADPQSWASASHQVFMDRENLLQISGPGCFKCEQEWTRKIAARPCRGSVDKNYD